MVKRPWVMPLEIKDYSSSTAVKNRTDTQLTIDIARAEQYIITYTHNKFENFEEIPESVRTAVILLAEMYARNAAIYSKDVKSETFDDYSYTVADATTNADDIDLAALLDGYVIAEPRNGITMRMRKL